MRVTGDGGGGRPGQGFSGGDRATDFRRSHRVGQIVRGVALRTEPNQTGQAAFPHLANFSWLRIDGHELLANVGRNVATGEVLILRIDALEPDIILRELRGDSAAGAALSRLVPTFRAARDRFETLLCGLPDWPDALLAVSAHGRQACFNEMLQADMSLLETYLGVLELETALDMHLASARVAPHGAALPEASDRQTLRFAYRPWLLPGFRQCELLTSTATEPLDDPSAMRETRLSFDCPGLGQGELRLLRKHPQAGFRIGLAAPKAARALSSSLQACAEALAQNVPADFLGVFQLSGPTGLAALLDADTPITYGRRI